MVITALTVITIIVWVSFEVYRALTKRPDVGVPPEILSPIDPTLDANTLDKLQERMHFEESEIKINKPTPTPTLTVEKPQSTSEEVQISE